MTVRVSAKSSYLYIKQYWDLIVQKRTRISYFSNFMSAAWFMNNIKYSSRCSADNSVRNAQPLMDSTAYLLHYVLLSFRQRITDHKNSSSYCSSGICSTFSYESTYSKILLWSTRHLREFSSGKKKHSTTQYSCFEKGCAPKPYATMPKGIIGNGGSWSLIDALGVSTTCSRETRQTWVYALSFLVGKHREPQSINAKLFPPIIPIGIVAYAFTLLWDNLCRNSCILTLITRRTLKWCSRIHLDLFKT